MQLKRKAERPCTGVGPDMQTPAEWRLRKRRVTIRHCDPHPPSAAGRRALSEGAFAPQRNQNRNNSNERRMTLLKLGAENNKLWFRCQKHRQRAQFAELAD